MSKKYILFSTADWDNPFWTNKQHVAMELARLGNTVLYIDSLGLRQPSVGSNSDVRRIFKRLLKGFSFPKKVRDNIYVWSPITLPFRQYKLVNFINYWFFRSFFNVYLKYLDIDRDAILWTYSPITSAYLDLSKFELVVYHCVDEIKYQPGMPMAFIENHEELLSKSADIIFTTSKNLQESRSRLNSECYYFPNVADFAHFNKASFPGEIPSDIQFENQVVGFIGAISSYKLDFTLIKEVAVSLPSVEFVFIGKVGEGDPETDIALLEEVSNIHFLGPRNYNVLPDYLRGFDVAIIPSLINDYTINMFPMKFFEYLSAGKPVVATNLPALSDYTKYFYLSDSTAGFIDQIRAALRHDHFNKHDQLSFAKQFTYESRMKEMLEVMASKG